MAGITFPNFTGQPTQRVDQLFLKTDFVKADLVSGVPANINPFIGSDGLLSTSQSAKGIFDLRPYSAVHLYAYTGGFTGSTAIVASVLHFDSLTPHPGDYVWVGQSSTQNLPAAGGGATLICTDNVGPYQAASGATVINGQGLTISNGVLFAQLQIVCTGTLTALTSLRVGLYGVRR